MPATVDEVDLGTHFELASALALLCATAAGCWYACTVMLGVSFLY